MNNIIENTLNLTANGKGGPGKTAISSGVEDWLGYQNIEHTLLDCDDNRSLSKQHPQAKRHLIKSTGEIESLIETILDSKLTIADTPGNITSEILTLFSNVQFGPALEGIHGRLVLLVPVTAQDPASFDEVGRLVSAVQKNACYIVVKNERNGCDFEAFDKSTAGQYVRALGASEIRFPLLEDKLLKDLNARRMSLAQLVGLYWELEANDKREAFKLAYSAQMASNKLNVIYTGLNTVAPMLLPTALLGKLREITPEGIKTACCQAWAKKQAAK